MSEKGGAEGMNAFALGKIARLFCYLIVLP